MHFTPIKSGGAGDITETLVKWKVRRVIPYVCSPIVQDNKLYLVKKVPLRPALTLKPASQFIIKNTSAAATGSSLRPNAAQYS